MTAVRHGVREPSWAAKPERRFDPSACEVKHDLNIVGLLLAAGSATRFGSDKLRHALPHGVPIAVQAARHLQAGVADGRRGGAARHATSCAQAEERRLRGRGVRERRRGHGREPRLRRARGRARRTATSSRSPTCRSCGRTHDRRGARRARRRRAARRALLSRAPRPSGRACQERFLEELLALQRRRRREAARRARTSASWSRFRSAIPA